MLYKNETITKGRLNVFLGWEHFNAKGNVAPGRMDQNLCGRLWTANDRPAVTLSHAPLPAPLTCATRAKLDALTFSPAKIGDEFGPTFSTHLFRLDITVPPAMRGRHVHLLWDSNTEAMVLSADGHPLQGLVGGNHWARRADYPLRFSTSATPTPTSAAATTNAATNQPENGHGHGHGHGHSSNSDAAVGEGPEPEPGTGTAQGGEKLRLYVEISCNGLFGAGRGGDIEPPDMDRRYKLEECCLSVFDPDAWALIHDATLLAELAKHLPDDAPRRVEALHAGNAVVNAVDVHDRSTYAAGRAAASKFLAASAGAAQSRVSVMLHSHIDLAWLWPMASTPAKGARTFSTKLRLLEQYPSAVFVQSQAQLYEWVMEKYPNLWEEVKQSVKSGRFIPVGATWVEMDCNVPSGESLLRQFVVGQVFFKKHFDITCEEFWLPDTFGYAAQLPQIMQGCGVKNFMTQKLSWNLFNKFPHTTFIWEGLDGSKVLAHMPSADTYNSQAFPEEIIRSANKNKDAAIINDSMLLVGHGDGGGGASPAMVESILRMGDVDGVPKVQFDTPTKFFARAAAKATELPRWVGELYFELHRGTYTSQAKTKQANRYCELLLRDAELAATLLAVYSETGHEHYPREKLLKCWKLVLKNCFHDTLPGSCIGMVYKETARDYDFVIKTLNGIIDNSLSQLCQRLEKATAENKLPTKRQKTENGLSSAQANGNGHVSTESRVVFNRGLLWDCGDAPYVMEVQNGARLFGDEAIVQPCKAKRMIRDPREHELKDGVTMDLVALRRRPVGVGLVETGPVIKKADAEFSAVDGVQSASVKWDDNESVYIMRNGVTEIKLQKSGRVVSVQLLRTKVGRNALGTGREVDTEGNETWGKGTGNRLVLYDDVPMFWDAWDTEAYAFEKLTEIEPAESVEVVENGPLRAALLFKYPKTKGGSTIEQTVHLRAGSVRVDFFTEVDWQESRKLLRAEFGTTVRSEIAWYDTQFGVLRRPTTANHSWEVAKFEVVGQRFADLSEHGFGVALMSDCKYGFSVRDQTMRVSLLRSSKSPDDKMDLGEQTMTFSVLAHKGSFPRREVFAEASDLNEPPRVLADVTAASIGLHQCPQAFVQTTRQQARDPTQNGGGGGELTTDTTTPEDDGAQGCLMVSAVKMSEDGGRKMVLRVHEAFGGQVDARVSMPEAGGLGVCGAAVDCADMLERPSGSRTNVTVGTDGTMKMSLRPFEICTLVVSKDPSAMVASSSPLDKAERTGNRSNFWNNVFG